MNLRTTIILIILMVALGAMYFVMSPRNNDTPLPTATLKQGSLLFVRNNRPVTPDTVQSITLNKTDQPAIRYEKIQGIWHQTSPTKFPLDSDYFKQIVDAVCSLTIKQTLAAQAPYTPSLKQAELDPAVATLTLNLDNNDSITLNLGKHLLGGDAYVQLANQSNILITTALIQQTLVEQPQQNLWATAIRLPAASKINKLSITNHQQQSTSLYNITGNWFLNEQATQRGNASKINEILQKLTKIDIKPIEADPSIISKHLFTNDSKLASISFPFNVPSIGPSTFTLVIGPSTNVGNETRHYAYLQSPYATKSSIFTVSSSLAEALDQSTADLRDPYIVEKPLDLFKSVFLDRNQVPNVQLDRNLLDGKLTIESSALTLDSNDIDSESASNWLKSLLKTPAQAFIPNFKTSSKPIALMDVQFYRANKSTTLKAYKLDKLPKNVQFIDTNAYQKITPPYTVLKSSSESAAHLYSNAFEKTLFLKPESLRKRDIFDLSQTSLSSITIRQNNQTYTFMNKNRDWQLQNYDNFERLDFNRILAAFSPLTAKAWVVDDSQFDFVPDITVKINTQDNASATQLQIDSKNNLASTNQSAGIFSLDPQLVALLNSEFRPRDMITVSPNMLASINVGKLSIGKNALGQYVANGRMFKDQSAIAKFVNTITTLQAKHIVNQNDLENATPVMNAIINTRNYLTYNLTVMKKNDQYFARLTEDEQPDKYFTLSNNIADVLVNIAKRF